MIKELRKIVCYLFGHRIMLAGTATKRMFPYCVRCERTGDITDMEFVARGRFKSP